MYTIPVGKKDFALVDKEDIELLSQYNWSIRNHPKKDLKYARHVYKENGKQKTLYMHQLLMGTKGTDLFVDHINHNGLDNRKENLRVCSNEDNLKNQRKKRNSRCKWKGLTVRNRNGRTYYEVKVEGKYVGSSECQDTAAMIYNMAAIDKYGEFASLNESEFNRG